MVPLVLQIMAVKIRKLKLACRVSMKVEAHMWCTRMCLWSSSRRYEFQVVAKLWTLIRLRLQVSRRSWLASMEAAYRWLVLVRQLVVTPNGDCYGIFVKRIAWYVSMVVKSGGQSVLQDLEPHWLMKWRSNALYMSWAKSFNCRCNDWPNPRRTAQFITCSVSYWCVICSGLISIASCSTVVSSYEQYRFAQCCCEAWSRNISQRVFTEFKRYN